MRVVFMGTPDFAVPTLLRLISDGHEVAGVFTQPDKPKGRKLELTPSEVKVCALENGIPVFQPKSLKNGEAIPILNELKPEVIVVAAYGMLLREDVLSFPRYGCINAHGSILPKYRGAAPIQWAVIDGEKETGVTAMQMDKGLDTGDMLLTKTLEIGEDETSGELFDRLSFLAADVISEVLVLAEKGELNPVSQDDSESSYARMLSKDDCPIDFSEPASVIHNKIRGLSPWPVAQAQLSGEVFKIHLSSLTDKKVSEDTKPGTIITDKKDMYVSCGDKRLLKLVTVQPKGSKRMSAGDYLRGHKPGASFD